ncbi:MAG: translation initiation factor IF-2 associated domain-containing protein, partial [Methylocella sp.]
MNDTKNPGDTLSVAPAKTLTLKRPVEAGIVRQSFSHGRSKAVVVEKVKRRAIAPGEAHAPREASLPPPPAAPRPPPQ